MVSSKLSGYKKIIKINIEGEEAAHGLYVKTVNGITADYDKDDVYRAFYVNGEYAQTGLRNYCAYRMENVMMTGVQPAVKRF